MLGTNFHTFSHIKISLRIPSYLRNPNLGTTTKAYETERRYTDINV